MIAATKASFGGVVAFVGAGSSESHRFRRRRHRRSWLPLLGLLLRIPPLSQLLISATTSLSWRRCGSAASMEQNMPLAFDVSRSKLRKS